MIYGHMEANKKAKHVWAKIKLEKSRNKSLIELLIDIFSTNFIHFVSNFKNPLICGLFFLSENSRQKQIGETCSIFLGAFGKNSFSLPVESYQVSFESILIEFSSTLRGFWVKFDSVRGWNKILKEKIS